MPGKAHPHAKSASQQQAAAIALHDPSQLYPENAGLKQMTLADLAAMAATKHKGLPQHRRKR